MQKYCEIIHVAPINTCTWGCAQFLQRGDVSCPALDSLHSPVVNSLRVLETLRIYWHCRTDARTLVFANTSAEPKGRGRTSQHDKNSNPFGIMIVVGSSFLGGIWVYFDSLLP